MLAIAMVKVAAKTPLVAGFYPPTSPEDLARLADRLQALAAAGHPEAYDLLSTALADTELDPVTKADLCRAWRLGNWPLLDRYEIDMLPAALAALLR